MASAIGIRPTTPIRIVITAGDQRGHAGDRRDAEHVARRRPAPVPRISGLSTTM